ncbi:hypothetical protein RRG08_004580 [Elysia crispata]|uniref:Uncharacterized protein n=1 Tax=Elysia crispata TaxID=231223 RepID=A0AAE1E1L4_9GAST|nr:hypothetical protein RRG08_004580 [Elysia crispata]
MEIYSEDLTPVRHYYLASEEDVAAAQMKVEAQGKWQAKLSLRCEDEITGASKLEFKSLLSCCACLDPQGKKKKALAQQQQHK